MITPKRSMLVAPAALLLAAACGSSPTLPRGTPAIAGPIFALGQTDGVGLGAVMSTVHVKQSATDPCGIIFMITGATRILRSRADGSLAGATVSDLVVGKTARVWATNVVLDSCPGGGDAGTIVIQE